jgi:signal peptidase II
MIKILTFAIAALVVILDRISKVFISSIMQEGESIPIWHDFVYFSYIKNQGVAFGLFPAYQDIFIVTTIVIICILVFYWEKIPRYNLWLHSAIGLILGGAIGNLWDRIVFGGVIDFIDIGYSSYRWPAFNLADTMICIGVGMVLLDIMKKNKRHYPEIGR